MASFENPATLDLFYIHNVQQANREDEETGGDNENSEEIAKPDQVRME